MIDFRTSLVLLMALLASACSTTPELGIDGELSDDLIAEFNDAARTALSKPNPRARSGSRKVSDIARSAVIEHDRRHVHLFARKIRQMNIDYHHRYIDARDWQRQYLNLFVNRGVVPNFRYRGRYDDYLLKLNGKHALTENSVEILKSVHEPWWSRLSLKIPEIQVLRDNNLFRGKNFYLHELTVIDPPAIRLRAIRMALNEEKTIEAVALHEAAHAVHAQIFGDRRKLVFTGKLDAISEATGNRVTFRHYREVSEFLADAVEIQSGSTAIRVVASRIVRGGKRVGSTRRLSKTKKTVLMHSHDASALFMMSLIREEQKRRGDANWEEAVDRLRDLGNARANRFRASLPSLMWVSQSWAPFIEELMQPEFEQRVRDEYAKVLRRTFEIVLSD